MRLDPQTFAFSVLLGSMAALPPLAIDSALPALPLTEQDFAVAPGSAGQTLSLFLAGFALAQLVLGPLSDRHGRRPVLLVALAVYVLAGIGCAAAPSIGILVGLRFLQGAGAASGTVLAFAIVRDLFEGDAARAKLSTVVLVLSVAPIIAPTLGGLLLQVGDWRGIYAFLAASGLLLLFACAAGLPESAPRTAIRQSSARAFARVSRHPQAAWFIAANALNFGCMFAYVTGSPLLLMGQLGSSTTLYGGLFACTAGGIMLGAWVNGRLARRGVPASLPLLVGGVLQTGTALALLAGVSAAPLHLAWVMPILVANTFCRGLVGPNATHGAMQPMPDIAGVASAALGFMQMAVGSLASAAVAALYPAFGAAAMAGVMALCAAGALVAGTRAQRGTARIEAVPVG